MHRVLITTAITGSLLALAGCDNGAPAPEASSTPDAPAWRLASEPEGWLSVTDAKARATEGETIAVKGRIGGRKAPLSPDSAAFTIVDLGVLYCGQTNPGEDGCATPWDYCCETPEDLRVNSATVQIVGAGGAATGVNPIAGGLEPLDEIIVVGTVGPRPDDQVLTIKATGVYQQ